MAVCPVYNNNSDNRLEMKRKQPLLYEKSVPKDRAFATPLKNYNKLCTEHTSENHEFLEENSMVVYFHNSDILSANDKCLFFSRCVRIAAVWNFHNPVVTSGKPRKLSFLYLMIFFNFSYLHVCRVDC